VEFCQRLSHSTGHPYHLPSEAEWEYACRAGTTTPFYFGETLTPKLARCKANLGMAVITILGGETAPVGSYSPNTFGLYDMHGNVWEWCADHWHENYAGVPTDGSAWITGGNSERRIVRGGSWDTYPAHCRSANRSINTPSDRSYAIGFRVVCGLFPAVF
jgi:formylglycine-generating enzyme required for sulfatase activity